ncbi:MAG: 23S rRNA accumulation protein YceD [Glaciecola sp.]
MTNVKLPKTLDPIKSAQKRSSYDGVYMASQMKRFSSTVAAVEAEVPVKVEFLKDAQGLTYFKGEMQSQVQLICQRCNGIFNHSVHTEFCFSPVQGSEEEKSLPSVYEPVEVNDHGEVDLFQLLEDELILSLPIVALHEHEDCAIQQDDLQFGEIEPEPERKNPFAVLKELKRD